MPLLVLALAGVLAASPSVPLRPEAYALAQAEAPLLSDDFGRSASSLGPAWTQVSGFWFTDGRAASDLDGANQAFANGASCADCRVEASVLGFGVPEVGLFLRAASTRPEERYQAVLLGDGRVQVRRHRAGVVTVLGSAASGLASLDAPATLSLSAVGAGPVALVLAVNGVTRVSVSDAEAAALTGPGFAGLWTNRAGVVFDAFRLWGTGAPPPPPDAGVPDAGVPDAGVPDAGVPDAGAPDAGPPDAGVPDAGPPDAGAPGGTLFEDAFTRTGALGSAWQSVRGRWFLYRNNVASDLDGANQLAALASACRDCEVQALVTAFGVSEAGVYLRSPSAGSTADRYDLVLRADRSLQIRRFRGGVATVLGTAASGLASTDSPAQLRLTASGAGPVQLTAWVNGGARLQVTDTSGSALGGAGYAGLWTLRAGVLFDDFRLTGLGAPPPPAPDAGTPDAGTPDAGVPDAGVPDAGTGSELTLTVVLTETRFNFLGVDGTGTAYATRFGESDSRLYASTDGARTWTLRGTHPNGSGFKELAVLSDGVLIADTQRSASHWLSRSTDGGRTWTEVLSTGAYRMLTPHSIAELAGTVYYAEYQTFTGQSTPIRVWASEDRGRTWSVRATLNGHRHAHGLRADAARGALWIFFGDTTPQGATLRSTDAGRTWTTLLTGQEAIAVDAEVLPNGDLLFGQDISYLPERPAIARLSPTGVYTVLAPLPGPSYSGHALRSGGYVIGATREPGGDIYPPGAESAYLYGSLDGVRWGPLLAYRRLNTVDNARMDVYWELPSGELVLELENVQPANGYQLLRPGRR